MRLWWIVGSFLIISTQISWGQANIDSLIRLIQVADQDTTKVNLLNEASRSLAFSNRDSSFLLSQQALGIATQLGFIKGSGTAHLRGAFTLHVTGSFDSALYHYQEAISFFEQIDDLRGIAGAENNMGALNLAKGNYARGLFFLQHALDKKLLLGDLRSASHTYNNIGIIKQRQKNYDESIQYFQKSIALKDSIGFTKGIPSSLGNIALTYAEMGNYDMSIDLYKEAYARVIQENIEYENLYNANGLADSYFLSNQLDSAHKYASEAYDRAVIQEDPVILAGSQQTLGEIELKKGNRKTAEKYLLESYEIANQNELLPDIKNIAQSLYQLYKSKSDYQKALTYLEIHQTASESLFNENLTEQLTAMELNFAFEQERDSVDFVFQKERLDLNADIKRRTLIQYFTVIGLVISIILIIVVVRFYRLKTKSHQQLSEKNKLISLALKEKDELIKEIHHRVKNNLQIISSLLNIQSKFVKDEEASKTIQDMQNRVVSMSLVHQNLYKSKSVTHVYTDEYLKNLATAINKAFNDFEEPVTFETVIERVKVESNQAVKLGLATNEILTNSFKHAFPNDFKDHRKIIVNVKKSGENIELIVEDNGVGFLTGNKKDSYGMRLIHSLTKSMNGNISISSNGQTMVKLVIPTYHEP